MSDEKLPVLMCHPSGSALMGARQREVPSPSALGSGLRFRFLLEPIENLAPWTQDEKPVLYWHALTYGDLWIDTPLGEVLRYTPEIQKEWNAHSPYVDHQVGNLYLELLGLVAEALEPVPPDIAAVVSDQQWMRGAMKFYLAVSDEDESSKEVVYAHEQILEAYEDATYWWHGRGFVTWNLVDGLQFHFWRVGDTVSMRWEFVAEEHHGLWTLPEGQFSLGVEEFEAAVFGFFDELLEAMQKHIDTLLRDGWRRRDCELDLSRLVDAQQRGIATVHSMKGRQTVTDWDAVRAGLARFCESMERAGFCPAVGDGTTQ